MTRAPVCRTVLHEETPPMTTDIHALPLVERLRIVSLQEAARLAGVSEESLRRNHKEKLIRLGPRRVGMRQGDALMLGIDGGKAA
jgi:hypothetical protein